MRYCAATETGFERLSGKSADVFIPDVKKDEKGKVKEVIPRASQEDYIKLAFAGIIAAYTRKEADSPIAADDILFEATPTEIVTLITAIVELRNAWYKVPETIVPETDENEKEEDDGKNVQQPANSSNES